MNVCYWTALTLCTNFNLEKDSDDLTMKEFAGAVGLYCSNMEPSWIVFIIPLESKIVFLSDVKVRFLKSSCYHNLPREAPLAKEQALAITRCWHLGCGNSSDRKADAVDGPRTL